MSTCPEKDLHSVYLDGEMPLAYIALYEEHVNSCSQCQAYLNKLKATKTMLQKDSEAVSLSESEIQSGYERLMARKSYKKVTNRNVLKPELIVFKNIAKYAATAAVAACAVALVIPARTKSAGAASAASHNVASFKPVARSSMLNSVQTGYNAGYKAQGTADMESLFMTPNTVVGPQLVGNNTNLTPVYDSINYVQGDSIERSLANYDVFFPEPEYNTTTASEKPKGFCFHFYSPLANISFEIGN